MPFVRRYPRRLATAGAAILLVCSSLIAWGALSTRATPRVAAQQPAGRAGVIYALTDNREQQRGEIVALEERTGAVLNRLPTRDEPDLLVTPDGNRLFILDTAWSADGKTPTHQLRLVEALSWRELARAEIADRISYAGGGPTGLALSPDKTRLFVYSYRVLEDSRADYWLTVVDARSLQTLPTNRIALPNCGGARLATLQRQVAVLCSHTNDLRFVDPAAATVTATLPLPALKPLSVEGKPSGLAMAVEGQTVYVITNDLRIIEIDASTHTLTREVASSRTTPQSVPLGAVEVSRDGQRLVVGVSSQPRSRATTFVLRSFALPSLAETETVTLPTAAGVAAAPDGGVYLFEGNELRLLGPERQQAAPLVRFDGRIQRLVR